MINKVKIVGVVLISIARHANRVKLGGTLKTEGHEVLARFLARTTMLALLKKVVNILKKVTLTCVVSKISTIPITVDKISVIVTILFSALVNVVFKLVPSIGTTGVGPVRTLQRRWGVIRGRGAYFGFLPCLL